MNILSRWKIWYGYARKTAVRPTGIPSAMHCYAAFPAVVPIDDGGPKEHALELRHAQRDTAGDYGEVVAVVTAAASLPNLAALAAGDLFRLLWFLFRQLVEPFFDAAAHKCFDLILGYFLIKLYNPFWTWFVTSFRCCVVIPFYQRLQTMSSFFG